MKRAKPTRQPITYFSLYLEGKKTEPDYFDALIRSFSEIRCTLKMKTGQGAPIKIAKMAVNQSRSLGLSAMTKKNFTIETEEVWAVFDRNSHSQYLQAINLCETNGVGVARSDPCFELWLVLHKILYNAPCNGRQIQRKLEEVCPEYDSRRSKTLNFDQLVKSVEEAEERAETLLRNREEEGGKSSNPSTTVGRLTRAIRNANKRTL